jgi:hypothetical protein
MAAAAGSSLLLALCALACAHDPEPSRAQKSSTAGSSTAGSSTAGSSTAGSSTAGSSTAGSSTAGSSTAGSSGVAGGLRALAAERGVVLAVHDCAPVGGSRVVICHADLSSSELATLRTALQLGPLGQTRAPGPAFGKSRCLDRAPAGAIALVTGFPWLERSHYRYLLIVVPEGGGRACVETEEGYG